MLWLAAQIAGPGAGALGANPTTVTIVAVASGLAVFAVALTRIRGMRARLAERAGTLEPVPPPLDAGPWKPITPA
jgi:hypothetical protein